MDQQQQLAKLEELGFWEHRAASWKAHGEPCFIQRASGKGWIACRENWGESDSDWCSPVMEDPWSAYCYAEVENWGLTHG